jgi:ABC-type glycerol-3-phosphate transport system substrate-binding protein
MPTEQSGPNDVASGERTRQEIAAFNRTLEGQHITVLNTQPPLDTQLLVTNPELTVVNWNWVSSQRLTLTALERFAVAHSVHVNIRFITWGEAFDELRGRGAAGSSVALPDVAQIGTTWTGYFAGAGWPYAEIRVTN